jgi:nucleotide-binding universal stress UspA family protein
MEVNTMRILVAYDGSDPSKKALNKATDMAAKLGGELLIVSVVQPVCPISITEPDCKQMDSLLRTETQGILENLKKNLVQKAIKATTFVKEGNPADEILQLAEREKVDTIILGSHGRHGAAKFFLGSVSSRVAGHSSASVLIVK